VIYRIGDKQSEKLIIPNEYKEKIISIHKYCTKPELEMFLIISEGLSKKYEKLKSKITPKAFAKDKIKYNGKNTTIQQNSIGNIMKTESNFLLRV